jgi:hypothetical protein
MQMSYLFMLFFGITVHWNNEYLAIMHFSCVKYATLGLDTYINVKLNLVPVNNITIFHQGGDHIFSLANFSFCFSNFLLGRNIYGPGKFIFGVFDNRDLEESFQVNMMNMLYIYNTVCLKNR